VPLLSADQLALRMSTRCSAGSTGTTSKCCSFTPNRGLA